MRNFFPSKVHGAAVSRPGSIYIQPTRSPTDQSARLVPFVYSDTESFCIEVGVTGTGNLYFRFYQNGSVLLDNSPAGAGAVYELLAGTTTADLGLLKWAQSGNTLILTHPTWPPQALRRLPNWAVSPFGASTGPTAAIAAATGAKAALAAYNAALIIGTPLAGCNAVALAAYTPPYRAVWANAAGNAGADAIAHVNGLSAQSGVVMPPALYTDANTAYANAYATAYGGLILGAPRWTLSNWAFRPPNPYFDPASAAGNYPVLSAPTFTPDVMHPAREWIWLCSLTVRDTTTGQLLETLPWRVSEYWDETTVPGNLVTVPYGGAGDINAVYPDMPVKIRRGLHNTLSALNVPNLGYVEVAMNVYRGRGKLFGLVGTTTTDTFVDLGAEPDWRTQPLFGTNPFAVTDAFGATTYGNPNAVAFYQDRLIFVGTPQWPAGVFASATGDYQTFDLPQLIHYAGESLFFSLAARKFEKCIHAVNHKKLLIGTRSTWWSFSGGQTPLDFDSIEATVVDEVGSTDLTPLMFEGHVLYARAKGTGVRGLFFDGRWSTYSSIDLSGQSDHLFVGNSIGFQGTPTNKLLVDWTYAEDPWGLIWAVRADGMLLSMTLKGQEYGWARHDGSPTSLSTGAGTPATYRRVCSVPEGDEDAVYTIVTRAIAGSYGTSMVERMASRVRRGNNNDDCAVDSASAWSGVPTKHLTSDLAPTLGHLFSEQVYVIGTLNAPQGPYQVQRVQTSPGNMSSFPPIPPTYQYFVDVAELPVENGGVGSNFVQLFIGLAFTPDLELLDVVSADVKLKQKAVVRVGFEVDQSSGILGGTDFDHLTEQRQNTVTSGYSAPVPDTKLVVITPNRKWDNGGRAVLRQSLPLPVTVVGAVRDFEIGG